MRFRSAIPIIYPYLFEPIHHIYPACLSRKQKLWFHILIMVSLSWLQWVMVNMFQISHPYYSRAWEAFFSNTTLPLKLLTAAAIWETEGFSYSYMYSHCSWTEQKIDTNHTGWYQKFNWNTSLNASPQSVHGVSLPLVPPSISSSIVADPVWKLENSSCTICDTSLMKNPQSQALVSPSSGCLALLVLKKKTIIRDVQFLELHTCILICGSSGFGWWSLLL